MLIQSSDPADHDKNSRTEAQTAEEHSGGPAVDPKKFFPLTPPAAPAALDLTRRLSQQYTGGVWPLLGVEGAVKTFKDLVQLLECEEQEQRNGCVLLDVFLSTSNIFNHKQLREACKKDLPELVATLWKRNQNGAATFVARQLVYVLLIEQDYFDAEGCTEIWSELVTKDMKICSPVLALLSALLTGEVTEPPALSTVIFDSPADCCPVLSAWSQFVDIVHCHGETLLLRLPANLASRCLGQLFKYHSVRRDSQLGDVLGGLLGNRELMAREDLMRTCVKEAAGMVLEEGLELDKTTSKLLRRLSKGGQFGEGADDEKNPTKIDLKGVLADLGYSEELAAGRPEMLKWSHLIELQARGADGRLVAAALERIKAADASKLLSKAPKMLPKADMSSVICICQQLTRHVPAAAASSILPDILTALTSLAAAADDSKTTLPAAPALHLCADLVRLASRQPEERTVVTLSLTIASAFNETHFGVEAIQAMGALLCNSLKYAHWTICNDQVAVYSFLVTKHFRNCQFVAKFKKAPEEQIERLCYGCTRIATQICHQEAYFSRVVCCILSETIMGYQYLEHAMCKLHSINDKLSSASLTTAMPKAEQRQYGRIFPEIKKSLKRAV